MHGRTWTSRRQVAGRQIGSCATRRASCGLPRAAPAGRRPCARTRASHSRCRCVAWCASTTDNRRSGASCGQPAGQYCDRTSASSPSARRRSLSPAARYSGGRRSGRQRLSASSGASTTTTTAAPTRTASAHSFMRRTPCCVPLGGTRRRGRTGPASVRGRMRSGARKGVARHQPGGGAEKHAMRA